MGLLGKPVFLAVFSVALLTCLSSQEAWAGAGDILRAQCPGHFKEGTPAERAAAAAKDDPTLCGHERMLRESNNVEALYLSHANNKVQVFKNAMDTDKASAFATAIKDGTCLGSDQDEVSGRRLDLAADYCLRRLRRMAADADVRARQQILRNNDGRRALMDEKTDALVTQPNSFNDPSAGPGGQGTTVLKDFAEAFKKPQVAPGQAAPSSMANALRLLAVPQQVQFTKSADDQQVGDALMKTKQMDKGDKIDVTEGLDTGGVDPDLKRFDASKRGANGDYEKDAALTKELEKAQKDKQMQQQIAKDQKALSKAADAKARGPSGKLTDSMSMEALELSVRNMTTDRDGKVIKTLDELGHADVKIGITNEFEDAAAGKRQTASGASGSGGSGTLDQILKNNLGQLPNN